MRPRTHTQKLCQFPYHRGMPKHNPPSAARLTLPTWLWGGNPAQFLSECKYRSRPTGGGAYSVQPEEGYLRQKPDLVRLQTIADPKLRHPRFEALSGFTERATVSPSPGLWDAIRERLAKADDSGQLLDLFTHQTLVLATTSVDQLPAQASYFLEALRGVTFNDDPTSGPFSNAGLHLIRTDPALVHRLKLASVWLRLEHDPTLKTGGAAYLKSIAASDQLFESSAGLYDGVYLLDAYLGPLLAAGTPGVWAVSVPRTFGPLVFTLGALVSGTAGEATELLQLISVPGPSETVHFQQPPLTAGRAALRWWTERLNDLFSVLSDLSVFTNSDGDYLPAKHMEAMLTIEQIFRRTTSALVAHRDTNARRALLFTVVDSIESVSGKSLLKMFSLTHAEQVLVSLERSLPRDAAHVLLPGARRAVDALRATQDGFFLRRQAGTTELQLELGPGRTKVLPIEEGAARYLKVLRDATHGHGSNRASSAALTDALLAHHNGEISHDLGLLAYLYLLELLSEPARLRRVLYRGGR